MIGDTLELDWRPAADFPPLGCGTVETGTLIFEATAPDGTGRATRTLTLFVPPC